MYTNILDNKTSIIKLLFLGIRIVKLIIERLIVLTMDSKHIELEKNAK
jgi:hypothetical protein